MCHLCLSTSLSRRQFLWRGAALALWLTNCATAQRQGVFEAHQTFVEHDPLPDLAGPLVAFNGATVTLSAPVGMRHIPVANGVAWRDEAGHDRQEWPALLGKTALVWLDERQQTVTAVQLTRAISAAGEALPTVPQPQPTGAKIPFGPLEMISRAGWGAADRQWVVGGESGLYDEVYNPAGWLEYPRPLAEQLHTAVIHHAALEFHDGPQQIQALHQRTAKFADIGYHFLIDGLGQLYEGRPLHVRGAHTGGHNTGYVGLCLLGNFDALPPLKAQLETLRQLLDYLHHAYGITSAGGHRDYQPGITVCPGQHLQPQLRPLTRALGMDWIRR